MNRKFAESLMSNDAFLNDSDKIAFVVEDNQNGVRLRKTYIDRALRSVETAEDSSRNAARKSAGMFKKKEAIESLQTAVTDNSNAIYDVAEALKAILECQKGRDEGLKYLYSLVVSNMAVNRSLVKKLELQLEGASKEEIDEVTRQELNNIVGQMKEQIDIRGRLDACERELAEYAERLEAQEAMNKELRRLLYEQRRERRKNYKIRINKNVK